MENEELEQSALSSMFNEVDEVIQNTELSTDIPQVTEQPTSTEGDEIRVRGMKTVYEDRIAEGRDQHRPGALGHIQDVTEGMARGLYENAAPVIGISDTIIDAINLLSADGGRYDIPKLPKYESDTIQALRNISGLVIPSLGLRSLAIQGFSKLHAARVAPPALVSLGNKASFQYFSKFGIDVGTGGLVDYVAEQNQKDQNLLGTLKEYWPKTFQWIPESIATNKDDSAGEKRAKNVAEGAIFNVLASIIEGAAYLTRAGRSVSKTSEFIPSKNNGVNNVNELGKDEFSEI